MSANSGVLSLVHQPAEITHILLQRKYHRWPHYNRSRTPRCYPFLNPFVYTLEFLCESFIPLSFYLSHFCLPQSQHLPSPLTPASARSPDWRKASTSFNNKT